jgi:hypothetical protein
MFVVATDMTSWREAVSGSFLFGPAGCAMVNAIPAPTTRRPRQANRPNNGHRDEGVLDTPARRISLANCVAEA